MASKFKSIFKTEMYTLLYLNRATVITKDYTHFVTLKLFFLKYMNFKKIIIKRNAYFQIPNNPIKINVQMHLV